MKFSRKRKVELNKALASLPRHENPIVKPKAGYPPEGKYFPLAAGSPAKAAWGSFFVFLAAMKTFMIETGTEAKGEAMTAVEAMKHGAFDYIRKPINFDSFGLILVNFGPLNIFPKINPPISLQIQTPCKAQSL